MGGSVQRPAHRLEPCCVRCCHVHLHPSLARTAVEHVAALLAEHRRQVGTRTGRRALGALGRAVMFSGWTINATKPERLAIDRAIERSTSYRYLDEALDLVAAQALDLHEALQAAKTAGHTHLTIDGALIATDRSRTIGPTEGVDLW